MQQDQTYPMLYFRRGFWHMCKDEFEEAFQDFCKEILIREQYDCELDKHICYCYFTLCFLFKTKPEDLSEDCFKVDFNIRRKIEVHASMLDRREIYAEIFEIYKRNNELYKAFDFFDFLIKLFSKNLNSPSINRKIATLYDMIATVYFNKRQIENSLTNYKKALQILLYIPEISHEIGWICKSMSQIYFIKKKYDKGFKFYFKAYRIFDLTSTVPDVTTNLHLAWMKSNLND
jgi:tetratricopeptide (TPR) repeat protein